MSWFRVILIMLGLSAAVIKTVVDKKELESIVDKAVTARLK